MRLIAANWKMNPQSLEEARRLAMGVEQGMLAVDRKKVETVLCPPFVFMPAVGQLVHFAKLGAQNVSAEIKGAHTGEVSVGQLNQFKTKYVIVGHSERRALGEEDEFVNQKVAISLAHHLQPILCVGFGIKKTMSEITVKRLIKKQVISGLKGHQGAHLAVAYEPVWAISRGLGTAVHVPIDHVQDIVEYIKQLTPHARVLYGGSVTSKNADELAAIPAVDGALVGGASLDPVEFLKIIKAFAI